jgi:phage tail-like protein
MATLRDDPYAAFNFTVSGGGLDPSSIQAGFSAVSGLDRGVGLLRYRAGNDKTLRPRLIAGLGEPALVTLSRGVIGDLSLHQWLETSLDGNGEPRSLVIQLMSEDRGSVAQAWKLSNALPVRIEGPALDALANAVAIETLVLAVEGIAVE